MDTTVMVALISVFGGGIGLKVVEKLLDRGKSKFDMGSQIREELRSDLTTLRERMDQLEREVHLWRDRYYRVRESLITVQGLLVQHGIEAKIDLDFEDE